MASRLQSCSQIRLSARLPLIPHLIKGGVVAGPPQATCSSEHPALLSAREEPLYMEMSPSRSGPSKLSQPGFSPTAGQIIRAAPMETWPGQYHNSMQASLNASKHLLTLLGYKLRVPARVRPRPDINRLSGLLMIYTRLCCAAEGGR